MIVYRIHHTKRQRQTSLATARKILYNNLYKVKLCKKVKP